MIKTFRIGNWYVGLFKHWLGFSKRFNGNIVDFGLVKFMRADITFRERKA